MIIDLDASVCTKYFVLRTPYMLLSLHVRTLYTLSKGKGKAKAIAPICANHSAVADGENESTADEATPKGGCLPLPIYPSARDATTSHKDRIHVAHSTTHRLRTTCSPSILHLPLTQPGYSSSCARNGCVKSRLSRALVPGPV